MPSLSKDYNCFHTKCEAAVMNKNSSIKTQFLSTHKITVYHTGITVLSLKIRGFVSTHLYKINLKTTHETHALLVQVCFNFCW